MFYRAFLGFLFLPTIALGSVYHYAVEAGPLPCVQEGYEACGDPRWIQHEFILDEALVPGGTLVNATLNYTLWAPYEGYVLPEWMGELWGGVHDYLFHLDFYMVTGAEREIVTLDMAILYLGETGWYLSRHDGITRGRVVSNCEDTSECTQWASVPQEPAQVAQAPIPAALPLLLAALAGFGLLHAKRRRA